jgi:hypothetical protein
MIYKYWISGNNIAIFRLGDVPEHGISLQDFKYVQDSCTFQEIYSVGKVKLQKK